jgi:hypothetical protein
MYNTEIDTIVLKIDCKTANEQREILSDIKVLLNQLNLFFQYSDKFISLSYLKTICKKDLIVYHMGTKLAVIKTGYTNQKFYITIDFAGLKSYKQKQDEQSNNYLLRLASYLNCNHIEFKIIELDICLDIESNFKDVLSVCVKKQPKVDYYKVDDKSQKYKSTLYLEKILKENLKTASIRSYQYDKSIKENIEDRLITRFEIKFQPSYFFRNKGEDISKIEDHLKRYYIAILVKKSDRNIIIKTLNKGFKNKQDKKLLEQFRVNHDIKKIEDFITNLRNIKLDADLENRRNKRDKQIIDFNFFNRNKDLSVENFIYTN